MRAMPAGFARANEIANPYSIHIRKESIPLGKILQRRIILVDTWDDFLPLVQAHEKRR